MTIKKHIPDSITSMNLLCGTLGIIFSMNERLDIAFLLMLLAAFFDFWDGFTARLLNASSGIGKELDSLADMVSFGVLPSIMFYKFMAMHEHSWLCYIPLLIAVFSALRLAKFNLDTRQTCNFIGLATPASAILCGSICYFSIAEPDSIIATWAAGELMIPVLSICLSGLLVSEIPMFSMKIKKGADQSLTNMKRVAFLTISVIFLIIVLAFGRNWSLFVTLSFTMYILMNIVFAIFPSTRMEI